MGLIVRLARDLLELPDALRIALLVAVVATSIPALAQQNKATLSCLAGTCYLRRQGSSELEEIRGEGGLSGDRGDTVMTIGDDSILEIDMGAQGGQAYLRNTGLTRIEAGRDRIVVSAPGLLEAPPNAAPGSPTGEAPPDLIDQSSSRNLRILPGSSYGSLSFFRDLPLTMVSPRAGDRIVVQSFPASLRLVFRLNDPSRRSLFERNYRVWTISSKGTEGSAPKPGSDFELSPYGRQGLHFIGTVTLVNPGTYQLAPREQASQGSVALTLEVLQDKELPEAIDTLLKSSDPQDGIELRTEE